MDRLDSGVSLMLNIWCCVLESCLVLSIGILSPFWLPLPLEKARYSLASWRRRVLAGFQDDGDCSDQELATSDGNATAVAEDLTDLGGRYLDLIAQAQAEGRAAASNCAPSLQRGTPAIGRRGCCGRPGAFFDASAYDEVVLTTDWEADGFLAACVVFAVFTAEARRAHAAAGGNVRPYPLRTVIVGEGDSSEKACRVREALAAMRRAGVVPPGCSVDVLEGSPTSPPSGEWESSRAAARGTQAQGRGEGEDEEPGERFRESLFGSFAVILRGAVTALLGRGWRRPWNGEPGLARKRLRELLVVARRQRQRTLVIALKPPRDLIEVLLERGRANCPGQGDEKGKEFDHVDLLVSGAFGSVFVGAWEGGEDPFQPRSTGNSRGVYGLEGVLSRDDVQGAMGKVNRVFVVQLDDLVGSYDFPRAISPDRTPVLAAAVAGARGALPFALRRVVAASNKRALMDFPAKVAAVISEGRYANEELQTRAETIAAAAAAAAAAARLAELGACMADLIATDFEALDAAGLSPGMHQAVFRSLDVRVNLSNVAAAWALACPDAVCWERFPFVDLDPSSGRVVPLKAEGPGGYRRRNKRVHDNEDMAGSYGDGDYQDGTRTSSRDIREVRRGYNRESGTATVSEVRISYNNSNLKAYGGDSGVGEGGGGVALVGTAGVAVNAFFATGFARWFERLEDQEAGYSEFAGFLVRVLDQMP